MREVNTPIFVGDARKDLVNDLKTIWEDTANGGGPRLIVLSAPIGWGKTRLVHELYASISESQPNPRYWPAQIDHDPSEPLTSRKRTHPSAVNVNPDAVISYLWWGLSCNTRSDGRRAQVLIDDSTQVFAHSLSIEALTNSKLRRALQSGDLDKTDSVYQKGSLILDVISCFGVTFPFVSISRAVVNGARTAVDIARRYRAVSIRSEALSGEREIDAEDTERQRFVDDLSASVSRLSQDSIPILILIDDVHDADSSVMNFVNRLLSIPENRIMIIATTWPDQLSLATTPVSKWINNLRNNLFGIVDVLELDPLSDSDLAEIVYDVAPNTSPDVVQAFVKRFSPNPFSLRQALSFRAVKQSIVDGAIDIPPAEIELLESDLASQYLRKWLELPESVREVLMIASELGPAYVEECSADAALTLLIDGAVEALSQSTEVFGWSVSLDSWVDAFIERDLYGLAREQWRRQFRPSDSLVVKSAVRKYVKLKLASRDWIRLSVLAQRTLLEFICKDGMVTEDLDINAAIELSAIYESDGRYEDAWSLLKNLFENSEPHQLEDLTQIVLKLSELSLVLNKPLDALRYSKTLQDVPEIPIQQNALLIEARAEADLGNYAKAHELLTSAPSFDNAEFEFEKLSLTVRLAAEVGEFHEAYQLGTYLIAELERDFRAPSPEHMRSLNLVSWAASRSGRSREALEMAERAVREAEEVVSDSHPELLEAKNNLARFLFRVGDFERAISVGQEVLNSREKVLGRNHQKTLTSMDNLAVFYLKKDDSHTALSLSENAIAGWKLTFGLNHPKALTARVHKLEILTFMDRAAEVVEDIPELLKTHIDVLGLKHPNTLNAAEVCANCVLAASRMDLAHIIANFVSAATSAGVSVNNFGTSTLEVADWHKNTDHQYP